MAQPMGLGILAGPNIVFNRNFRFTMSISPYCGSPIPPQYVKLAAKPNWTIEETQIDFLNGRMWIPGKASFETISVTFYSLTDGGAGITPLYSWLATVYDFTDPIGLKQSSKIGQGAGSGGYSADAVLTSYDGCGTPTEAWNFSNMWVQSINFGGTMDYSSSDETVIEATLRYSQVKYVPYCGGSVNPCCSGC